MPGLLAWLLRRRRFLPAPARHAAHATRSARVPARSSPPLRLRRSTAEALQLCVLGQKVPSLHVPSVNLCAPGADLSDRKQRSGGVGSGQAACRQRPARSGDMLAWAVWHRWMCAHALSLFKDVTGVRAEGVLRLMRLISTQSRKQCAAEPQQQGSGVAQAARLMGQAHARRVVHRARLGGQHLLVRLVVRRCPPAGCPGARALMRCALPSSVASSGGRCALPAWVCLACWGCGHTP